MAGERAKAGFGAGWALLAGIAALIGFVTFAAASSVVAEVYPLQPAGVAVAVGCLFVALVAPTAVGTGLARALHARGYRLSRVAVVAGVITAVNLGGVVALQLVGPAPVRVLLVERGTWVVDALTNRGPFGPAAIPVVQRRLEEVAAARYVRDAIPLWCDEDAAAFAVGLAGGLAKGGPAPLAETLGRVVERHGAALEGVPADGIDGRLLLTDVHDIVAASFPDVELPPQGPIDPTPSQVDRKRIAVGTTGWEARFEDGAWRWCPGTAEESEARGDVYAQALRDQARRVPTAMGAAAGPWDSEVRTVLQQAAFGRTAWLAGSTSVDASWAESLTRTAAAAQGERIRVWCTAASKSDPSRALPLAGVVQRWSLPPVGVTMEASNRTLLEAQGRRYLTEVLTACTPLLGDRQVKELSQGIDVPDAQRRRWAELDARTVASEAQLTDDGTGGVKIEIDGRAMRAVQEDGAWRIDWRD
jgi:hypothetical protein